MLQRDAIKIYLGTVSEISQFFLWVGEIAWPRCQKHTISDRAANGIRNWESEKRNLKWKTIFYNLISFRYNGNDMIIHDNSDKDNSLIYNNSLWLCPIDRMSSRQKRSIFSFLRKRGSFVQWSTLLSHVSLMGLDLQWLRSPVYNALNKRCSGICRFFSECRQGSWQFLYLECR